MPKVLEGTGQLAGLWNALQPQNIEAEEWTLGHTRVMATVTAFAEETGGFIVLFARLVAT